MYYATSPQPGEVEGLGLRFRRFTEYGCPFWDVRDAERYRWLRTERFVLLIRGDRDTSELPESLSGFSLSDYNTESQLCYEHLAIYLWPGIFKYTWNGSAKIMKVLLWPHSDNSAPKFSLYNHIRAFIHSGSCLKQHELLRKISAFNCSLESHFITEPTTEIKPENLPKRGDLFLNNDNDAVQIWW